MTTATNNLSAAVQQLIDARLDNIERVLMASGTSRLERQEITASVEDQIMELIARKGDGELDRDQMLQILASLDPPEAYIVTDAEPTPYYHLSNQPNLRIQNAAVKPKRPTVSSQGIPYYRYAVAALIMAGLSILFSLQGLSFHSGPLMIISISAAAAGFICGSMVLISCNPAERTDRTWMAIAGVAAPIALTFPLAIIVLSS